MHVSIFDFKHVKVIWGHSVHFSKNWAVTPKRLIVGQNGQQFGGGGGGMHQCWYFLP